MSEIISKLDGEGMIGLIAVMGTFIVGLAAVLGHFWQKVRVAEADALLKQDMLNRGMTAEQICEVLQANSGSKR